MDRSHELTEQFGIEIAANDTRIYLTGSSPAPYLEATWCPFPEEKKKQGAEELLFRNERDPRTMKPISDDIPNDECTQL